ncbi:MAG: DUF1552 domain-containing protein [Bryobacteraceae bacterium]|nr:DUF1552 domain-containing protein [Bryobacteraceae bacterium]
MTRKHLSRRFFLRGAGCAVALPLLDSMVPAFAKTATTPTRMAFVYVPNGIIMKDWTPVARGPQFDLTRTLEPLAAYKEQMVLMTGLTQNGGRALGDGPGDHARAASSYLTGVHPRKTAGADIQCGVSVDQVAAQAVGGKTRFASLEFGCEDGRLVGNCDSGYSCAYSNSISWRGEATPMPPEINPRVVFERLFGGTDQGESPAARASRERSRRSILDLVSEDAKSLQSNLGPTDNRKLDEYLTGIREIEKRIQMSGQQKTPAPTMEMPDGIPADFVEHSRLMFELMALAFQTDQTRIQTFMLGREGSNRTYREIGVPDPHHGISHHKNDEVLVEKLAKINRHHMDQFAVFIDRLAKTQDGDGTLLDHSMIVYGSGLSDGNRHLHHDLPVLMVGAGSGAWKTGRHVEYAKDTPMNNLFVTMLDRMGVPAETLGDATGKLNDLTV